MPSKINIDTKKLHPDLQSALKKLISECDKRGLYILVTQGYRTIDQQNAIVAKGNSHCSGNSFNSPHQWGAAIDFARNDGKGIYDDSDGFFRKVGKLAETLGFQWGGDWTGFCDKPHLQLAKFFDEREDVSLLKRKYGTPNNFIKTWKKQHVK